MRLRILLIALSLCVCALVNPGNFGTVDTTRRLQVTRWIRLGEPPVRPNDPGAGPIGRNGVRHPPTGVGQSLVLLPFDAISNAALEPVMRRAGLDSTRQSQVIEIADAFLMQSFLTACLLLLAYDVLLSFGFSPFVGACGVLALLLGTTVLQYIQCAQENLLLLALAMLMLWAFRRYRADPRARWALIAGLAAAFALITRMNAFYETAVLGVYGFSGVKQRGRGVAVFLIPVAGAVVFDRWYQYLRFGDVLSTYIGITQRQFRPPGTPENYYFSYPFWKGFWGAFFSHDKSILLFDPLLVVLGAVLIWNWRYVDSELRVILGCLALLALIYISSAAKYIAFGGDVAWGDRYVLLPVQMLCLFALPLFMVSLPRLSAWGRWTLWTLVAASVLLQAASTTIAPNLEVEQRKLGYDDGVLWNRAINIADLLLDRGDPGRYAGIPPEWRSLYYFPYQLRARFPSLAQWAIAGWLVLLVIVPLLAVAIVREASSGKRAAPAHQLQ